MAVKSFVKFLVVAVFLNSVLVLSGCGGGGGSSGEAGSPISDVLDDGSLAAPRILGSVDAQQLNLFWRDSNADSYRVLYWLEGSTGAPSEYVTNALGYSTPSLSPGRYSVIVEAYDELGNSLFSDPLSLEVL